MGMKSKEHIEDRKRNIMHTLSRLPRRILQLHGRDNVIEFVLHELGRADCFNLHRAAYVIDNPDFNCLKGVAGFCKEEAYCEPDIWDHPEKFSDHMKSCAYNNQVRCYNAESYLKHGKKDADIVKEIAKDLGFEHPSYYAWQMKHDNHGLLLYEKDDEEECDCDYLIDGLCLIGFCPVF